MFITSIGPKFTGNNVNSGRLVYSKPVVNVQPNEYSRHEQNIIRTIGLDRYQEVCKLPEAGETKKISYLLNNLDDKSMIIIGNPYTDENQQALGNLIGKHPDLVEKIDQAYVVPSGYDNAVFITKSEKEDNIGIDYFMVHSDGKIRIETPFWSLVQSRGLKTTRHLRPGDVFTIDKDNHHIKLETKNAPKEKPKGISTVDFFEFM